MELAEIYADCRDRLISVGPSLSTEQRAAPLLATPPWVVVDAYRHLAGVCADVLDGRMEGAGSSEWTATQLADRQDLSLEEVSAEWTSRAEEIEAAIATAGVKMSFMAFDAWTHAQDVRAAAGLQCIRDEQQVALLAAAALGVFSRVYPSKGGPTLRVVVDGGDGVILGEGDPVVALRTTAYELMRIVFGRRSRAQVEQADWEGEGIAEAIDALHLFDFPPIDIVEP